MLEDHLCWRVCLGSKNIKELLARPVYCFLEEIWSQAWEELGRSDRGPHFLSTCRLAFLVPSKENVTDGETA